MSLLEFKNVSLKYKSKASEKQVFENMSFELMGGEFCILTGKSNSGKTSLLDIISGNKKPTKGEVLLDGINISRLREGRRKKLCGQKISYVRQGENLYDDLSIAENFKLATRYSKKALSLKSTLKAARLEDREKDYPKNLSNTEKLSLAVAIAVAKKPRIILCDDPIAGMDNEYSQHIFKLLVQTAHEIGVAVIFATTNDSLTGLADKHIEIKEFED